MRKQQPVFRVNALESCSRFERIMEKTPIIRTQLGGVQGKVDFAANGRRFWTFHAIPYAEPPLGPLRFKAPRPAKPWSGVLNATIEGDECYSKDFLLRAYVGSEDCLKLNVFTPVTDETNQKKPVMVWIHGGGFTSGSSKVAFSGPEFFMCEDIVLVSINYRLGIFGFLSLSDKSLGVPGNAGMKDQVMALRWVQEHIGAFGGDASNVTIFGESAGAASIHLLLCSPMAKGLFHKCILQSGSALSFWARGQHLVKEIAGYFNVQEASEKVILDTLMSASKEDLQKASALVKDLFLPSCQRSFAPVVEGFNPHEESFLMEDPMRIMRSGKYTQVPIIIGYNTQEGLMLDLMEQNEPTRSLLISDFWDAIPFTYGLQRGSDLAVRVADKIQHFYYGLADPLKPENRKCFRTLSSDNFFLRGIYQTWHLLLATNAHPVYVYRFAMEGELNIFKRMTNVAEEGVAHGDDIFYMFKTAVTPKVREGSVEDKTIKRFIGFWTNFAKTSDPNGVAEPEVRWLPTDGQSMLHFGDELKMIQMPESQRMVFWDQIDNIIKNKL